MSKKIEITTDLVIQVKTLFDQKIGARQIAKQLGISRWIVQKTCKVIGVYNIGRHRPKIIPNRIEYRCIDCNEIKPISAFRMRKRNGRVSYESCCLACEAIRNNGRLKKRAKILRENDPNFVIRRSVSYMIWKGLKNTNSSKNGESCLSFLPYSIEELRSHLEAQFEPWMTWDNHGRYIKSKWDDSNLETWNWQIDHIIPQSDLPYSSMEEDNFKRCWDLSNLRPFSAKQNNLDGTGKTRHNIAA
jgi:hypothetical protein